MKNRYLKPRLLYPAKLSIKIKREMRNFPDKKKLEEFVNTKSVWKEMLNGLL